MIRSEITPNAAAIKALIKIFGDNEEFVLHLAA